MGLMYINVKDQRLGLGLGLLLPKNYIKSLSLEISYIGEVLGTL